MSQAVSAPPTEDEGDELIAAGVFAHLAKITQPTVWRMRDRDEGPKAIPVTTLNGHRLNVYRLSEVRRWIAERDAAEARRKLHTAEAERHAHLAKLARV